MCAYQFSKRTFSDSKDLKESKSNENSKLNFFNRMQYFYYHSDNKIKIRGAILKPCSLKWIKRLNIFKNFLS